MKHIGRRDFVISAALIGVAAPLLVRMRTDEAPASGADPRWIGMRAEREVHSFDLHHVRLRDGLQRTAQLRNGEYMMSLDPARIVHTYRVNAGLPSAALPLGGWEAPTSEHRGRFAGHYLSACALHAAATGDDAVKARGAQVVAELAECQRALGGAYLGAFPATFFDELRDGSSARAPFDAYHKLLAGLIGSHTLSGNAEALAMAKGMASWAKQWVDALDEVQMARVLESDSGGMGASLYDLSEITGRAEYAELAHRFDREKVIAPLSEGSDEPGAAHGNVAVSYVVGAARRFEVTGDARSRAAATFFWDEMTTKRSFATGGTTTGERSDSESGPLASALFPVTQESCVSHDMLELTRRLFTWEPDPKYADYHERVHFNSVLPAQHWKLSGARDAALRCCHGTGTESFAKLGDSVYFRDGGGLYVNLFVPSEVEWKERELRIVQDTAFPVSDRIALTVDAAKPSRFALRIRMPWWATNGGSALLNGHAAAKLPAPRSWYVLDRVWNAGDRVEITLPMNLHTQGLPGDAGLRAIMYGPLVLAARLGTEGVNDGNRRAQLTVPTLRSRGALSDWVERVPGTALEFRTKGQASNITLAPLHTIFDERHAVYFRINS